LALTATAAGATEVLYNNLNTVPATVNGMPDEDTYSLDFENFPIGGLVKLAPSLNQRIKAVTTQVDSFTCEHGVYSKEESCLTLHSGKTFKYTLEAKIYAVGPSNETTTLLSSATQTFRIHFRPTTNNSCPATVEGKGFGPNCDVGGLLNPSVKFTKFSPRVNLPEKVAILITNTPGQPSGDIVNVGLQSAYKEFNVGKNEFVAEPPANGGVPAVGSDPAPKAIYKAGLVNEEEGGWEGFQPVFKLETTR
jgi:hypothetical protein